jgi:PAS domain S-box-containing protein
VLKATYDPSLVVLSILIAVLASYAALDLSVRVVSAQRWARISWFTVGSVVMGIGIWSMHFTGMFAFTLPVPIAYHWPTVLLSFLITAFSSAIAFYIVTQEDLGNGKIAIGGIIMGVGIAAMHYTGMASMRLAAVCQYDRGLVILSVVLAIVLSLPPLWLVFHFRRRTMWNIWTKMASASVMGVAISTMHYTGMASATFFADFTQSPSNSYHTLSVSTLGAAGIGIVTMFIQGFGALIAYVDQRRAVHAVEVEERDRFHQIADTLNEVLALTNADCSEVLYVNRAYQELWGRTSESLYAAPASWIEAVHPADRTQLEDRIKLLLKGEPLDSIELQTIRPDGSICWVVARGYPVRDSQGNIYRLVCSAQDITKRKQAEVELQRLSGRLLHLQDEERRSIARDLHDSTAQDLVVLATTLRQLHDSPPPTSARLRQVISECETVIDRCLREVRTLSYLLHPPMLEKTGLEDAIGDYVEGFSKRSEIQVDLELPSNLGRLPRETELALFRVVQESLTNIQRHSGSPQATIRIERDKEKLTIEIIDKGHGIAAGNQKLTGTPLQGIGVGIPSMQERVKQIGGTLEIESSNQGTTVRVTIPAND